MERLILKYLDKNFIFTLSTLTSYKVKCKSTNEAIPISFLHRELLDAFDITEEELLPILDKWNEKEFTRLNNIIVDSQYLRLLQ